MDEPQHERRGPLHDVRIVEVGNYMSVPFATMMLADLGASVTKVEPPKGDPFRRFGRPRNDMAAVFANSNRGKTSVVLDLKQPDGRDRLLELVDIADVLVSNWRPGVAERLSLSDSVVAARNARLLRVYVTGYGPSGPYATAPTFDSVVQAISGLAWAQGAEGAPQFAGGYLVDKVTAMTVAQATLAALYERRESGVGHAIEVSMLDAAAYLNFPELFASRTFLADAELPPRNLQAAEIRPLQAADGWFVISAVSGDQVRGALRAVGRLAAADALLGARDGVALIRGINEQVEQVTRTRPLAECLAAFAANDVPCAPVLDPDQHFEHPQVVHNEIYDVVEHPTLGAMRRVRHPAMAERWGPMRGGLAPTLPPA